MNNRNFFIVMGILLVVAVIGLASYLPARTDITSKTKVANFPMVVGEWSATDIPLSEKDYEILETRNLFVRDYKNAKGESVYLYIVYSEDNRKVSHPPEVCLMGSGLTVAEKTPINITPDIKANKLLIEKTKGRELVVYWYKAGKLQTDQYMKQQLKVVLDRTFGRRTAGALIRLSAEIRGENQEATLNLLKAFASLIEPLLAKYVP